MWGHRVGIRQMLKALLHRRLEALQRLSLRWRVWVLKRSGWVRLV